MTLTRVRKISPEKVIDSTHLVLWTTMNTLHTATATDTAEHIADGTWMSQIKLAIVLSVIAAASVLALAGRVSDRTLIVGVIVVASAVAWSRVELPEA